MPKLMKLLFAITVLGLLPGSGFSTALAAQRVNAAAGQPQILTYKGIKRSYVIRVPERVPAELAQGQNEGRAPQPLLPLVLVLHGGGGNAAVAENMTGFTEKAGREGFIVVYPEGSSRFRDKLLTWNAGHCCGYAKDNGVNDVEFLDALLDQLTQEYPVDPKRIYATGMSNGGMMTHRLGIALPHRFAAIAPVVGALFGDENKPALPVSALMINGMLDQSVPVQGGAPGGRFATAWDGTPPQPAREQAVFWANANGCANPPEKLDGAAFVLWQYRCPAGRAVEIYLVKDNGHAWPGGQPGSRRGDKPSTSLNATDVIWEFFKAHPK